ncbi:MAG: efflux RND transporter periplasmic adaptor subunit [Prevotellaceae bacterium]|jgi:HlyD family secretion protein|nr:efflux RND transporter periplasmic adaptor subunit [Prevotellaceae bacterium]
MKTVKAALIAFFALMAGFIAYRSLSKGGRDAYTTVTLRLRDVSETIHIPGNVFPAKEIEIKSQLSGILENISVKIGDYVKEGAPVAAIKLVPGTFDIERLESSVNTAQIEYDARKIEYERAQRLYATSTISHAEMDEQRRIYKLVQESLNSAINQLDILKKGRVSSKNISNLVKASTSGTVIDLPLEVGASVIERNNYNPGTTVAVVAETKLFKFRTLIAEHYLRYLSLGDTISLSFSAYQDLTARAAVVKISSKGNPENGIMKYLLEAEFTITDSMPVLRSGYSATAEIVLQSKANVLSVEEKHIVYQNDSTYLYLPDTPNKKAIKRTITTGVSDGIYTEITAGATLDDKIITNYDKVN